MFDLSMMVAQSARQFPQKTALISGQQQWTYAELDAAITTVANRLRAQGLAPGQAVGLQLKNTPSFVITYYGVLRAGLVVVPFNPLAVEREVEHILAVAECRAAVVGEATAATIRAAAAGIEDFLLVVDSDPATESPPLEKGELNFAELLAPGPDTAEAPEPGRRADDDAVIIFTSGTTGRPKGAALSHFNLWMSCTTLNTRSNPTSDEIVLGCLPLFHVFGMSGILNIAMAWGVTLVLMRKPEAEGILDLVETHEVTRFSAVPTMLSDIVSAGAGGRDLSTVRRVTSGGSALRLELISQFEEIFPNAALLEGYGASETTSSICVNQSRQQRKIGSVGTPSWGTRMRITDKDGTVLPAGEDHIGELQVTGPTIFNGYVGDCEATEASFAGDWFRTGDLARIDEDGYVFIVGRLKELIIRAGYNVYPSEVEQTLQGHSGISQAVVVGLHDDRVGQEIAAVVVPHPGTTVTEDEIKDYARAQISAYKCPRIVKVAGQLPHSTTGKVLRREVLNSFFS